MIVIHNSNYYQKTFGYLTNKQISANLKLQQQHVRLNLILFKENIIAEGLLLLRCLFRVFFLLMIYHVDAASLFVKDIV